MIPDLKNKFPYLLTIAPTIFWATLISDYGLIVLGITLIGAVLSGIHIAIEESIALIPKDKNIETRLNEFFRGKIVSAFFSVLIFYTIFSFVNMVYFVFIEFDEIKYYQWLLIIVMIILAVSYVVGMMLSKEKRDGFLYASNLGKF